MLNCEYEHVRTLIRCALYSETNVFVPARHPDDGDWHRAPCWLAPHGVPCPALRCVVRCPAVCRALPCGESCPALWCAVPYPAVSRARIRGPIPHGMRCHLRGSWIMPIFAPLYCSPGPETGSAGGHVKHWKKRLLRLFLTFRNLANSWMYRQGLATVDAFRGMIYRVLRLPRGRGAVSYTREVSALLFYDTGRCESHERYEGQKYRLSRFFSLNPSCPESLREAKKA